MKFTKKLRSLNATGRMPFLACEEFRRGINAAVSRAQEKRKSHAPSIHYAFEEKHDGKGMAKDSSVNRTILVFERPEAKLTILAS